MFVDLLFSWRKDLPWELRARGHEEQPEFTWAALISGSALYVKRFGDRVRSLGPASLHWSFSSDFCVCVHIPSGTTLDLAT